MISASVIRRRRSSAEIQGSSNPSLPMDSEGLCERDAIPRAQKGDTEAFEFLYRLHSHRVYSMCLRMVGNTAEAEDLTQEAFLQVFRKISTFRGDSAFSTWLHRLTVNVVLMHLRKRTLPSVSMEAVLESDEENSSPRREFGAPDLRMAGLYDRLIIEQAIEQLPPGYRSAFVMHDVQGYEHNEIAEIRGCSTGNSKSQLHKARTRMRQLLRETLRLPWLTQTSATEAS